MNTITKEYEMKVSVVYDKDTGAPLEFIYPDEYTKTDLLNIEVFSINKVIYTLMCIQGELIIKLLSDDNKEIDHDQMIVVQKIAQFLDNLKKEAIDAINIESYVDQQLKDIFNLN